MRYRIEYDRRNGKYEVCQQQGRGWLPVLLGACVLLIICAVHTQAGDFLRGLLIPGEDAVTVRALRSMTDDLRSGAELWDALACFCETVIHEG